MVILGSPPKPKRQPPRNPPLKIAMLLHFYACLDKFAPEATRCSPAYVQFVRELLRDGLIERPGQEARAKYPGWAYRTTPKGAALVEAICTVPNPVANWTIPNS
jgi:hypothetical protein